MRTSPKMILAAALLFSIPAFAADTVAPAAGKEKPVRHNRADTNKDGLITKAEFMAESETRFKEFDVNADGSITREEFKARREARRVKNKQ